jgi:hypothetical protein
MAASLLERGLVGGPGEVGSRSSSRRFAANADVRMAAPVTLPPGRPKLATKPFLMGSPPATNTIGIVVMYVGPWRSSVQLRMAAPTSATITASSNPALSPVDAPSPAQGWELFALQSGTSAAGSYNRHLATKRAARFLFSI